MEHRSTAGPRRCALLAPVLLLLAALLLAGCGSASADGSVPPGTVLDLGESAVVAAPDPSAASTTTPVLVELAVTGVRERPRTDIAALEIAAQEPDLVPYFVTVDLAGVDPSSARLAGTPLLGDVHALARGGEPSRDYLANVDVEPGPDGGFWPCDSTVPEDVDEGSTVQVCVFFLAPPGTEITEVHYMAAGTDYADRPVIWKLDTAR